MNDNDENIVPVPVMPGEKFEPPAELTNFEIGEIHAGLLLPNKKAIHSMAREIRKWRGVANPDSL